MNPVKYRKPYLLNKVYKTLNKENKKIKIFSNKMINK